MAASRRAFLGLGSNLGDRRRYLRGAIRAIPDVVRVSSLYETDPIGGPEQGAFLNCVVEMDTALSARELLALCGTLETEAERVRIERWGPRTLDVDVVYIDGETVNEPDLIVPHLRWRERAFVMVPLGELAPDLLDGWVDPDEGEVRNLGPLELDSQLRSLRIIGAGRAGRSFGAALAEAGVAVDFLARDADAITAGEGVDAVLIATPDRAIDEVAARIAPSSAVVLHCSGATGLDVLAMHERHGSVHPLMALPDPEIGAKRLANGGWFAVAGDEVASDVVALLGGRRVAVADEDRAAYHAAASISANHLVALLAQVERIAAQVGVPAQAFFDLAQASFEDVVAHGAAASLTGPAARGDVDTLDAHRAALPVEERALYDALAAAATALASNNR